MASSTVLELAKEMKVTAEELLRQLKSAGIDKHSETDAVGGLFASGSSG